MPPEISSHDTSAAPLAPPPTAVLRPAWWVRLLARLPLGLLYGLAAGIGWLAFRVVRYRARLVRDGLVRAFPEFDAARRRAVMRSYYMGYAQMLVELIKSASMRPEEIRRRVRIINLEAPRTLLAQGQPVLLVAAHQCNWEWMLLALSLELGYPLDAAYKPLVNPWAEREMKILRSRFGSRLVPAKELLADIIQRHGVVRAVAMVADQEPTTSEHKYWTRFLNRDTAFYMGPEEISRVTRFPVFFIAMRRTARGYYEMEFQPLLPEPGAPPAGGALTERYARVVEEQIRAAPADWPWSHKRWKLRKSVYTAR
jgi:Kdo2-lipid IVA lauroyltransferase/acyltransferase